MILLILGVALWCGAHLFKRMMPDRRARLGEKGKVLVALGVFAAIALMTIGYRMADYIALWWAPGWAMHLNNLAVLIAIFLMSPASKKGVLLNGLRHPMLMGFALWAAAHLLVNGDLASLILFGGLGGWAVATIFIINRAEPDWMPAPRGALTKDGMFFLASVVLLGAIGYVHGLVGPSPFPG